MGTVDTPLSTKITVAEVLIDLKYIRSRIDEMCNESKNQDSRLDKVEKLTWAGASLVSLLAAIFIPIAVAAVKKWLGL